MDSKVAIVFSSLEQLKDEEEAVLRLVAADSREEALSAFDQIILNAKTTAEFWTSMENAYIEARAELVDKPVKVTPPAATSNFKDRFRQAANLDADEIDKIEPVLGEPRPIGSTARRVKSATGTAASKAAQVARGAGSATSEGAKKAAKAIKAREPQRPTRK